MRGPPERLEEVFDYEEFSYFLQRWEMIEILKMKGFKKFLPIQYETFDWINHSVDLIGRDRTGSGKTVAYSLPVLERFREQRFFKKTHRVRFIVILPTRELAIQVCREIESLKLFPDEFRVLPVYGGTPIREQVFALRNGVDIIVTTPGRMIDLLGRNCIDLEAIQAVCLDEADEMLKQGFQQDVERILEQIESYSAVKPQMLLFSATIPTWVQQLADKYLSKFKKFVDLIKDKETKTSVTIDHLCLQISRSNIVKAIGSLVENYAGPNGCFIIFCETKRDANEMYQLCRFKFEVHVLHGDIEQASRERTFQKFRKGQIRGIVATNVAARGIDIPAIDLIIQTEPPKNVDDYIHRSGRTGRVGKKGVCITCYSKYDSYLLGTIEKIANMKFEEITVSGSCSPKRQPASLRQMQGFALFMAVGLETVEQAQFYDFMRQKIHRNIIAELKNIRRVSTKAFSFHIATSYRQRLAEIVLSQKNNFLCELRLEEVTSLEMLSERESQGRNYTIEQYEQAMRNKNKLEVFVKGLAPDVDESILVKFFAQNGVNAISARIMRDDYNNSRGFAFVHCLDHDNYAKAFDLNGAKLERETLVIDRTNKQR